MFDGWRKVLEYAGHQFFWWPFDQQHRIAAHDIFNEIEPDLFIGTTFDLDRATCKCIRERSDLKVALYASAWGSLIEKIDYYVYPIVIAQPQEKELLGQLKAETGRPNLVFLHYPNDYVEETLGGWSTAGIKPIGLMNAADIFDYFPTHGKEKYIADLSFVGGYWQYKAVNLDRYMIPLCDPARNLNIKIYGNQPWPVPNYLGHINTAEVKHIFASSSICPNVSEPHSTQFGFDLIERPFKALACKAFCLSDCVKGFRKLFTEAELPMCGSDNPHEFFTLVQHYLKHPDLRKEIALAGYRKVMAHHTYFHRMAKLFRELDLPGEAEKVMGKYNELLAKNPAIYTELQSGEPASSVT